MSNSTAILNIISTLNTKSVDVEILPPNSFVVFPNGLISFIEKPSECSSYLESWGDKIQKLDAYRYFEYYGDSNEKEEINVYRLKALGNVRFFFNTQEFIDDDYNVVFKLSPNVKFDLWNLKDLIMIEEIAKALGNIEIYKNEC